MKQGRRVARIIGSVALSLSVITILVLSAGMLIPEPPDEEIKEAMESISEASSRKASVYSGKLYREAESAYNSAMAAWREENRKFIFLRDYSDVIAYAGTAAEKGRLAARSSETSKRNLRERVDAQIAEAGKINRRIERLFGSFPLRDELRSRLAKGRLLLREAQVSLKKNDLLPASRKITDAENLLTEVFKSASGEMRSYFASYPQWKKWAEASISESSRNNSPLVLVDKIARRCYLYSGGKIKHEFEAEFGVNWVGDKKRMGDKATPEGRYYITRKYQGKETPYYRSLAINYPDKEDKERFNSNIKGGLLPPGSKIGSGIEIHGGGGKGVNWTNGCVALANRDMDIIFPLVRIGTPVTIVGSLKSIEDIISDEDE